MALEGRGNRRIKCLIGRLLSALFEMESVDFPMASLQSVIIFDIESYFFCWLNSTHQFAFHARSRLSGFQHLPP